jgi:CBS domain-containing protein
MNTKRRGNITRIEIAEISIFAVSGFVIILLFGLTNESLLFVALIFGIYLIVSGRISQLKFMDFEIKLKDVENKELDLSIINDLQIVADLDVLDKDKPIKLDEKILPKLIREAKKIKVLRLTKSNSQGYIQTALAEYLKYFTHVVFIDDEKDVLSGFVEADTILEIIKSKNDNATNFMNTINKWTLNSTIIEKNVYVIKGASRKQVLEMMKQHTKSVLPVVSLGLRYEGVIDYDSIIWQITKDFYDYTKTSQ